VPDDIRGSIDAGTVVDLQIPMGIVVALHTLTVQTVDAWQEMPLEWVLLFAEIMNSTVVLREGFPGHLRNECETTTWCDW
jgi:hypothetical protein